MPALQRPVRDLNPSVLFDAIIIGAGPAGLSAALALSRAKRTAVVFSSQVFRNDRAHRAHTVFSRDHQKASDIRQEGKKQIEEYGTTLFIDRAVVSARNLSSDKSAKSEDTDGLRFEVTDSANRTWQGRRVLLATGCHDVLPENIPGYADCWGSDIWQCLFCDGIERSHREAGILGFPNVMWIHFVDMCVQMGCPRVTIFGNGKIEPKDDATKRALALARAKGVSVDERKIVRFEKLPGESVHEGGVVVHFDDGEVKHVGFIAHKPITEVNAHGLADYLGVEAVGDGMGGTMLKRNEPFCESNVKGVFVAGDSGTMLKQFSVAMTQGVMAGGGIAQSISAEENERLAEKLKF